MVNFFTSPRYSRSGTRDIYYIIPESIHCYNGKKMVSTIIIKKILLDNCQAYLVSKTSERIRPEHSSLMMWPMK